MTNSVSLEGILLPIKEDGSRCIEVKRAYKNDDGVFEKDIIPCIYWNNSNRFNLIRDGTLIRLQGRVESINSSLIIIVECFDFKV